MAIVRLFRLSGALIAGAALLPSMASAADLAKGREKADQVCAACHGKDGNTSIDPSYPRLAGQSADYLEYTLIAYQKDLRKNPIMGAQAKLLTRAEIRDLAAYYASLPGQLTYKRK